MIIAPVDDRPISEDIVEQGSERDPRFTIPGGRPSRAAGILAIVTLLAGLAIGYAIGSRPGGRVSAGHREVAGTPRSSPAPTHPVATDPALTYRVLTEEPGTCSTRVGKDLELGIPVTNMATDTVLLRSAEPIVRTPSLLKVLSWHWVPCGFDADGIVPATVALGPGETTWLTATVRPLVACPAPAPVQFRVTYSADGQKSTVTLPGFADLSAVRYSGCKGR